MKDEGAEVSQGCPDGLDGNALFVAKIGPRSSDGKPRLAASQRNLRGENPPARRQGIAQRRAS